MTQMNRQTHRTERQTCGCGCGYRGKDWELGVSRCKLVYKMDEQDPSWRSLLRVPWTARRSNQSILKEITLNIHWKNWRWSWSSNSFATWIQAPTCWKRPWYWERLKAGGEGDDRGWVGRMASLTQWTWVWANSGRWWRTGKPGML